MDRIDRSDHRILVLLALVLVALAVAGCATRPRGADPCAPAVPCDPCAPTADAAPGELPPEAQAGEAWCRVWLPPEVRTIAERVCVQPAEERQVQIPPRYGTRPRLVCVSEPQLRERVIPAVWGTRTEQVLVCPPREEWRRVDCPPGELGPCEHQGECYVKCVRPGVYRDEPAPVCLAPERRCVEYTPAQYKVVEERYLLEPGRCETRCVPAVFETRCREEVVRPGRWVWRRNETCEVPACAPPPAPAPLPAIQVEMVDKAETGAEAGIFGVGDLVRYDLSVVNDEGETPLEGLRVLFTLPAELVFVSGGDGIPITGAGQSAESAPFTLPVGGRADMFLLCRVVAAPPTNLVQLSAQVVDAESMTLAEETESTSLKPAR